MYCWPLYVCMRMVVPSVVLFSVVFSVAILYCPGWHSQLAVLIWWLGCCSGWLRLRAWLCCRILFWCLWWL